MIVVTMSNGSDVETDATVFKYERDVLTLKKDGKIVRSFPREKVDFVTPVHPAKKTD